VNPLADIRNICFFDTETRALPGTGESDANVKTAGTYRYARNSFVIIATFAIGDGPVIEMAMEHGFDGPRFRPVDAPSVLLEFHRRVERGEAWYAAWNAGFDRNVWNHGTKLPPLRVDDVIDVMAQATAANLPPSLHGASMVLGLAGKLPEGKELIRLFSAPDGAQPHEEPEKWRLFKEYALRDTALLRDIWRRTNALPMAEWEDYWVSERINERGVAVDVDLAARAAKIAAADKRRSGELLTRWTGGVVTAVTQTARIVDWVYEALPYAEARELMVTQWDEDKDASGDEEADLVPAKMSVARDRIAALLAFFAAREQTHGLTDADRTIVDVLTVRQFGGSSSPGKFAKMVDQHVGGRLHGQYVFNGAPQTGRFSSKGVQVHNLTRSTLGEHEAAAIDMINRMED